MTKPEEIFSRNKAGTRGLTKYGTGWAGQVMILGVRHVFRDKDRKVVEQWLIDKRKEKHGN